jgi:hypothetical protein
MEPNNPTQNEKNNDNVNENPSEIAKSEQAPPTPAKSVKLPSARKRKILIGILIFLLLAAVAAAVYFLVFNKKEKSQAVVRPIENTAPKVTRIEQVKKIYYVDNNKLYSINPLDKKVEEIDTQVSSGSGGTGSGMNTPLTSPDQFKVAYINDGKLWLKEDGKPAKQIDFPKPNKPAKGEYTWLISAWSSDSKNFTYSVALECGIDSCDDSDIDKNVTGVFWYSLSSGKPTKLPIDSSDMWVPGTSKVAYFDDNVQPVHLKTYDVVSKQTATLTKTGWSGLPPQLAFSDDGSKIIYVDGDGNANTDRLVIANADNTGQSVQKNGRWAEHQWPRFIQGSTTNYLYSHSEGWNCPDGGTGCPGFYLYTVLNGKTKKITQILSHIAGFYTPEEVITLRGYFYDTAKKRTLSLININTAAITDLYSGNELLDLGMTFQ